MLQHYPEHKQRKRSIVALADVGGPLPIVNSKDNFHIYDPRTQRHYFQNVESINMRVEPFRFARGKTSVDVNKSASSNTKKQKLSNY